MANNLTTRRRVSATQNGETTIFVCAGNQIVQDYTGDNINGYSLNRSYIYGDYIDQIIAHIEHDNNDAKRFYHYDRRNNVIALSGGSVVQYYYYDAYGKRTVFAEDPNSIFGNPIPTTDAAKTRYGFTGREHEVGAEDIMYFRSRYYHTTLGRFTKHDVDYLDGLNLYAGYLGERWGMDPTGKRIVSRAYYTRCGLGWCKEKQVRVCEFQCDNGAGALSEYARVSGPCVWGADSRAGACPVVPNLNSRKKCCTFMANQTFGNCMDCVESLLDPTKTFVALEAISQVVFGTTMTQELYKQCTNFV